MDKIEVSLLEHLEKIGHFQAVATHGSFLGAARSLGQSQPTLLYSVKTLEAVIGTALFIRSHTGVRLTSSGQKFL
ncbi:MAG: LysR family transcriptional regulator [Pseudobdellovibrionaceae bacterium]